jgi:hypothetical protein
LPALVIESVREFARSEYGVDLLKLESPLAANGLPRRDGSAAAKAAQQEFDAIGEICSAHRFPGSCCRAALRMTSSSASSNTPVPRGPAAS